MRALVYLGPDQLELENRPTPTPREGEALIRIRYAGICGTDLHLWHGEMSTVNPPVVVGHELVGEVVTDTTGRYSAGQRVAVEPLLVCGSCLACRSGASHVCRTLRVQGVHADGGAAELLCTPTTRLHAIPDGLSWEEAGCTEPVSVAVHMVRRAGIELGDTVLVLGGGPIGFLVANVAKAAGARRVLISEVSKPRLSLAEQAGIETIDASLHDPVAVIREITNGEGADVVVEAVGHPATVAQMIPAARVQGRILVGGIGGVQPPTDLANVVFKELTLIGSRVYSSRDMATAVHLLGTGAINVKGLVTRTVPLEHAVTDGYERLRDSRDEMKILLAP
ncbi:MAG: alcohol dehydrogenase catalytic domain-containing protein [Chloroflexi bacterium]|nr:alcohol dehydrogenase catalytic domain-containing protein [Chloroflexota bacterium]